MKIRAFEAGDRDRIISLWDECGLVVPRNDPEKDIARKLEVDPDLFLVGVCEDRIVATVVGLGKRLEYDDW